MTLSVKRLWWGRPRSRGHVRSTCLIGCCLLTFLLLLNSVLVVDRALTPDGPTNNSDGQASSLPAPDNHSSRPLLLAPLPSFFDAQNSTNNSKKAKFNSLNSLEKKDVIMIDFKGKKFAPLTTMVGKNEPAFGFVNKNFTPKKSISDVVQGFVKGEKTVNPGMLLGAVAAFKSRHSSGNTEGNGGGSPQTRKDGNQGLPDSQVFLKPEYAVGNETETGPDNVTGNNTSLQQQAEADELRERKDNPVNKKTPSRPPKKRPLERGGFDPGNVRGAVEAVASILGQDSAGKLSGQSVVSSLMSNIASPLIAGALSNNNNKVDRYTEASKSSPLQSLFSEFGPALLSGIVQQGLGGGNSNPRHLTDHEKSSPLQSFISQMGPSLLAGAVQQGLSVMKGDQSGAGEGAVKSSPVKSVLRGLGSALIAGVAQDGIGVKDSHNSNPVQSILSGLVPALVAGALSHGLGNDKTSSNGSPAATKSSPMKFLVNGLGPAILSGLMKQGLGGATHSHSSGSVRGKTRQVDVVPVAAAEKKAHSSRTLQVVKNEGEVQADVDPPSNNTRQDTTESDNNNDINKVDENQGGLVRLVARAVVGNLMPEELTVPAPNSTHGAWDMMVNLAFGNPKDGKGRKSQFWEWLRDYGGEAGGTNLTHRWITEALNHSPQRVSHLSELTRLYKLLEGQQSICTNVKSIGGVFNWKTNVLDDSRVLCMDTDVALKRDECVVYSFGVGGKWSFEEDMERMGCEVWAFDPSPDTGNHNHTSRIHFYNVGLAANNITRLVDGQVWNLFTFAAVVGKMNHQTSTIDYLKLDINGDEWEVLQEVMLNSRHALTNVKQLGLEIHLDRALRDPQLYKVYLDTLLGLESFGFQLFSSSESEKLERCYDDPLLKRRVSLTHDLSYIRI
ncbi:uncharacterized protein LOC121869745 isoform X2 [Homarus americanus]|uniref:uncharacterized protein LOC121869745 isoform X2 n=1 Tax=Homarus americanus TaxID=6706 RepID=UPI001C43BCCD|nr:uncharacterized protein LOC121869745 isoform X2 [Homarus americanus]